MPVIVVALAAGAVAGGAVVSREWSAAGGSATTAGSEQSTPGDRPAATGLAGSPAPSAELSIGPTSASAAPTTSATASPSASPTVTARTNPRGVNLALHRTVRASSVESGSWPASDAVDGSLKSRWSSGFADPQWITVDLGAVWQISDVRLAWEHAYAVSYRVDVSLDAHRWSTVYRTTAGTNGTRDVRVTPVPARYVRMYGTKRVSQYGYSLLELEVR